MNRLYVTNDYSIVSKYSAIKNGYFSDEILEKFVEGSLNVKSWRRTPLVNRGYAARLLAIDWIVTKSIQHEHIDCFIVLGGGYDTLPFRPIKRVKCWIEIDLPQVINNKVKFLREHQVLGETESLIEIEDGLYLSSSNTYGLISCDLRDSKRLRQLLLRILPKMGSRIRNIAILNEVCLCYLAQEDIVVLLRLIIKCVENFAFRIHYIGYEQIRPENESSFNNVILDHFDSLGYPIKHYPTSQDIRHLFLKTLNFHHLTVASMFQIFHNVLFTERFDLGMHLKEPFDEFEEMDLYLAHYALVTGVLILKDPFLTEYERKSNSSSQDEQLHKKLSTLDIKDESEIVLKSSPISRFGHSSCLLKDNVIDGKCRILISGGFGKDSHHAKHQRLSSIKILTLADDTLCSDIDITQVKSIACLDRMHGQIQVIGEDGLIFFNGGRQSPAKTGTNNTFFIGKLEGSKMIVKHQFDNTQSESNLRWRHKLSPLLGDEMIQIGGLGFDQHAARSTVLNWNMSSSKLGFSLIELKNQELLNRHSFAMDMKDANTLLIYGGLETSLELRDKPSAWNSAIWDRRVSSLMEIHSIHSKTKCYGSNIHFIDDHRFINIGGISTETGQCNARIELYDLRNDAIHLLNEKSFESDGFMLLSNSTSCHFRDGKSIITFGGGGNYFTFGTFFNEYLLMYKYE